jgi:hypothetical protein
MNVDKRGIVPIDLMSVQDLIKVYLPVLTPLAAVTVSVVVSYSTYEFNRRAAVSASSTTLGTLISEFGRSVEGPSSDRADTLAAMKLAIYGEQALPAVKIVLSSDDGGLRRTGVLVAQQMYRSGTVNGENLSRTMLSYYENPSLRLGVLEWVNTMERDLSVSESRQWLAAIQKSFGPLGRNCTTHNEFVALEATKFINTWLIADSDKLLLGMITACRDAEQSARYQGARNQALLTLPRLTSRLSRADKDRIISALRKADDGGDDIFKEAIDAAIVQIQEGTF